MRKILFVFVLGLLASKTFAIDPHFVFGNPISLVVMVNYDKPISSPKPKSPTPEAPEASIDDHTLYLYDVDYDLTLYLLDEDGDDVYTVFIPANTASVVLPSTLTGDYELQLYTDGLYYFSGYVEL